MAKLRSVITFSFLILTLFFTGCAKHPGGPAFDQIEQPKENLSTVYFYRAVMDPEVMDIDPIQVETDRKELITLDPYGYFVSYLKPGHHRFWGKVFAIPNKAIEIETEGGKVYFIKYQFRSNFAWVILDSTLIDEKIALEELKTCSLQTRK